jgi:hypothetical protein
MYYKLYKLMTPKLGQDAARAAVKVQYSNVVLVVVGITDITIGFAISKNSFTVLLVLFASLLAACAYFIYTRVQLANEITEYLDIDVQWYQIPNFTPVNLFDKWLDGIKMSSK